MIHTLRPIYGDTDMMGVVYYANYLRYFESARSAWFRDLFRDPPPDVRFRSYRDLEELGIGFPVTEAHCVYRRPARYEDVLDIDVRVTELRRASLRFGYRVRRGDDDLAHGYTVHACIGRNGRAARIPENLRSQIPVEETP